MTMAVMTIRTRVMWVRSWSVPVRSTIHFGAAVPRLWVSPRRKSWCSQRALEFIKVDPNSRQIVEVTAEAETHACSLEGLSVRVRQGVLVVRPLLTGPAMFSQTEDHDLTHDHNLCTDRALLVSALALKVRNNLYPISACPAAGRDQLVEAVRIGARVHVRKNLALYKAAVPLPCCADFPLHD